jgi:uncharacterized protein
MSKKSNSSDQDNDAKDTKPKSKRRMQIGISSAVITIALIIIFMPKNNVTDTTASPAAPMFKKQGECTLMHRDEKPIVSIDIEIADDDSKREIGMMGRPVMDEHQGMLFVFEQEFMASFWMKNCILSLDMIFIDKLGQIVTICKNTTPFSEQSYSATSLTLLVLEVNAGFTDKYGIKEGDRIIWKRN